MFPLSLSLFYLLPVLVLIVEIRFPKNEIPTSFKSSKNKNYLGLIGGYLILISLLFPVITYRFRTLKWVYDGAGWMFGLHRVSKWHIIDWDAGRTGRGRFTYLEMFTFIFIDILGIISTISLICLAIMIIKSSKQNNGAQLIELGISSLGIILWYLLLMY